MVTPMNGQCAAIETRSEARTSKAATKAGHATEELAVTINEMRGPNPSPMKGTATATIPSGTDISSLLIPVGSTLKAGELHAQSFRLQSTGHKLQATSGRLRAADNNLKAPSNRQQG